MVAPTPPDHSGGASSTMISHDVTPRTTYPQAWASYNVAQQHEKERFLVLLKDLCSTVPQPPQSKGRPRLPLADMLFAATFKVYSGFSSRRFTSDIQAALQDGLIDHVPHFNSTNRYLADPALTPLLKSLIEASASPLAAVESDFAADSTGFATSTYSRWFDHKWGKERSKQAWKRRLPSPTMVLSFRPSWKRLRSSSPSMKCRLTEHIPPSATIGRLRRLAA